MNWGNSPKLTEQLTSPSFISALEWITLIDLLHLAIPQIALPGRVQLDAGHLACIAFSLPNVVYLSVNDGQRNCISSTAEQTVPFIDMCRR